MVSRTHSSTTSAARERSTPTSAASLRHSLCRRRWESDAPAGHVRGLRQRERCRLPGENGYPIPTEARTQPNYIEGGVPGGGTNGDRHLIVVDRDRWVLFELFATRWNNGRWEAGSGAVFDLSNNARRPEGWTSADAAGLAIPARTRAL
jgi:hypothetical protein